MWTAIQNWFGLQWLTILKWGAIIGGGLLVVLKIRESGRQAEQVKNLNMSVKVKNEQLKAAVNSVRTRRDLAKQLRDGKF